MHQAIKNQNIFHGTSFLGFWMLYAIVLLSGIITLNIVKSYMDCFHKPGPVFCIWLSKMLASEEVTLAEIWLIHR